MTLPNAPRVITCLNLSQAAEDGRWGHPARTQHSALWGPRQTQEEGQGTRRGWQTVGRGVPGPHTVQAAGGRFSPEGRVTASAAEGSAREELDARRPLKDMNKSSWELPVWGRGKLSSLQVARQPLLSVQGQILHPHFGNESCYPELGETTTAPSVPGVCRAEQT